MSDTYANSGWLITYDSLRDYCPIEYDALQNYLNEIGVNFSILKDAYSCNDMSVLLDVVHIENEDDMEDDEFVNTLNAVEKKVRELVSLLKWRFSIVTDGLQLDVGAKNIAYDDVYIDCFCVYGVEQLTHGGRKAYFGSPSRIYHDTWLGY